jgi:CHASE3 domain sensor protein
MFRLSVALFLIAIFPVLSFADTRHVVSPSDLQNQLLTASHARQQNINKVERFLSSDVASKAMNDAHVNAQQIKNAVPGLNDQELAKLAARADTTQANFAAGNLGPRDVAIVVLGVVVIILIIVVAH